MQTLTFIIAIGIGATMVMDVWGLVRKALFNVPLANYAMIGRWVAHMPAGRFLHRPIAASPSMPAEHVIGWFVHYLTGILFAAILILGVGPQWMQQPSLVPALVVGIITVIAPFFIMQPAMGAGIAASRTPNPKSARMHSLITHGVFGFGLYIAGSVAKLFIG